MHHAFVVAAFLQAVLAERGSQFGVEQIARTLEVVEGVLVQHLGPGVGIIARAVATVEDVTEVGAAVAGQDFGHQADGVHLLFLEGVDVEVFYFGQLVELHVEDGGGDEFGGHEALVEQSAVLDLRDEAVGHRLAGLVVLGVHADDFRLGHPVFHDLRRHLHVVVRHVAAGARVEAVTEESVQRVAKLVPHSLGLVPSEQGRGAARSRGEVHHERDDGIDLLAVDVVTALAEARAPGTAALRLARVVVHVKDAEEVAVGFFHFVGFHARIIDGQVGVLRKGDTIQLIGSHKHAVAHVVDGEVRLDLVFVEGVFGLAEFFGVVPPVPAFELDVGTFGIGDGLHLGQLLFGELLSGIEDVN